MLVEVKLLGKLGQRFGRIWHLAIRTPIEAIRAIAANCPEFTQYLYESDEKGITYRVIIDDPQGIDESLLDFKVGDKLIIAPIIRGAGGGFGKVLLGGALLAASFFMPATISVFGLGISSASVGLLGASLLFGGIHQMISPVPKTPKAAEKENSFLFDRAQEVSSQGNPVPVGYGERIIVDPVVISSYIASQEIPL
jgi:predicted phage tail protein